ncbi:hypothetical protein QN362_02030 [Actimicrobium sp. CCC2.4]|uniref:hypothetical protein n=1 Tax=Actimicrobium sp. CCC2.4 TaxID=3048606 RepID=UPI002AC90EBD|nr:hypothetical protein [Actimicrobium sp. CCC2.4]MEB0134102.1 hypothetical protein [Actimicrobium sp. CCC2.4]WPX31632.1 hypothetical protein RHM62_15510 [Actimicrobium sp. CCC2.4]
MTKLFSALLTGLLVSGLALTAPGVLAATETGAPAVKKDVKKKTHTKKAAPAAPAAYELAAPDDDDTGAPIDASIAPATEYKCELGNTLTIFRNDGDDNYIALRWHKVLTRMKRVATTTGAHRFENKRSGLVWIGIPAKGLLLDSRKGQQLANECKDPTQMALATAAGNANS